MKEVENTPTDYYAVRLLIRHSHKAWIGWEDMELDLESYIPDSKAEAYELFYMLRNKAKEWATQHNMITGRTDTYST